MTNPDPSAGGPIVGSGVRCLPRGALTAIHDEENNFTTRVTAKPAILLILLKRFF
jgi:hypothetical protein